MELYGRISVDIDRRGDPQFRLHVGRENSPAPADNRWKKESTYYGGPIGTAAWATKSIPLCGEFK